MKRFAALCLVFFLAVQINAQEKRKKVGLFWDTSYSMIQKDLKKEIQFLILYFKDNPNIEVSLTKFSNDIIFEKVYDVVKGNWVDLRNELINTVYDGTSIYSNIKVGENDEILIFTDGNESLDKLPNYFSKPAQIISSSPKGNVELLKKIAAYSNGNFTDLSNVVADEDRGKPIEVSGTVKDIVGPLAKVKVFSRETKKETLTDENGNYKLEAVAGGILEFRADGKNTLFVNVSASGVTNVILSDGSEILDEINVYSNKEAPQTELEKKKNLGYAVQKITSEDIGVQDISVENAIVGRFSNVSLKSDQNITEFLARGRNMTMLLDQTGLIVIDGVPIDSAPNNTIGVSDKNVLSGLGIDPFNIDEIKVLKGLAATNKYGTIGRNGVIEIKTKSGTYKGSKKKKKKLGTTLTYTDDALEKSVESKPYIKELQKSESIDEAYSIYLKQRKEFGNTAQYFFDVARYFNNWGNKYMVKRVLSNVLEFEGQNAIDDKMALAFHYEVVGLYEEAAGLYLRILESDPSASQVYRNLALAYKKGGNSKEAQKVYNKIHENAINEVESFDGIRKAVVAEYKNLVALNKKDLDQSAIPDFFNTNSNYHKRIVFEWSYFNAEFDIQIVNPQKRFFTWSHTQRAEPNRFENEQNSGYGIEEFFITESDKGNWLFNLTYFGKYGGQIDKPVYLKVTTYSNFGKSNQTEKVQLFTLQEINKKETIVKLKI